MFANSRFSIRFYRDDGNGVPEAQPYLSDVPCEWSPDAGAIETQSIVSARVADESATAVAPYYPAVAQGDFCTVSGPAPFPDTAFTVTAVLPSVGYPPMDFMRLNLRRR